MASPQEISDPVSSITSSRAALYGTETQKHDFTSQTSPDDVIFILRDQRIYASKAVLTLVSPVFAAMFGREFAEKYQAEVDLPGKNPAEFCEFLRCIYPNILEPITRLNVFKVLPLADEYQVPHLVRKCEEFLLNTLREGLSGSYCKLNFYDLLLAIDLSHRLDHEELKEACLEYIERKGDPVGFLEYVGKVKKSNNLPVMPDKLLMDVQRRFLNTLNKELTSARTTNVKALLNFEGITGRLPLPEIDGFEEAEGGKLEFTVPNMSTLSSEKGFVSGNTYIFGTRVFAHVKQMLKPNDEHELEIELEFHHVEKMRKQLLNAIIVLVNYKSASTSLCERNSYNFNFKRGGCCRIAIPLDKMAFIMKPSNGFIKDNSVKIMVLVLANKSTPIDATDM